MLYLAVLVGGTFASGVWVVTSYIAAYHPDVAFNGTIACAVQSVKYNLSDTQTPCTEILTYEWKFARSSEVYIQEEVNTRTVQNCEPRPVKNASRFVEGDKLDCYVIYPIYEYVLGYFNCARIAQGRSSTKCGTLLPPTSRYDPGPAVAGGGLIIGSLLLILIRCSYSNYLTDKAYQIAPRDIQLVLYRLNESA